MKRLIEYIKKRRRRRAARKIFFLMLEKKYSLPPHELEDALNTYLDALGY